MKKQIGSILMLFLFGSLQSQEKIEGVVKSKNNTEETIIGATIHWTDTNVGVVTDENGKFSIPYQESYKNLIISYLGYKTDTLTIASPKYIEHFLIEENILEEVAVQGKSEAIQRSFLQAENVMRINSEELLKAACCNLSESFETNPSIDVNFSDALTGAKQIQMLGLTSPYLLITEENIPSIRGASQAYGLSFIPGSWVKSIQITKGAGSVVNGFESISGQINTELAKPYADDKFFVNAYGSNGGRLELNTHWNQKINDRWHTGFYVHGDYTGEKFDRNEDGFLDNPLSDQFNIMNRWQYTNAEKGWVGFINFKYLKDNKQLGQLAFDPEKDKGGTQVWGSQITTDRIDISTKIGYVFPDLPFQSMGFQMSYSDHHQDSYFGIRDYAIKHRSLYGSFSFNSIIGDTRHKFKTGTNFMYDTYGEFVLQQNFARQERSVGAFFEYAYDNADDLSITAGLRIDTHNLLGTFLTPRIHARYTPWHKGVFRTSVGRGRRSANIFAENQQMFSSSRNINVIDAGGRIYGLAPEEAWNYGFSFLQGFKIGGKKGDVTLDFYQTNFVNQVVVDWENPQEVAFYNLSGSSVANSFQVEWNQNIIPFFNVRVAYKVYDVTTDYRTGNLRKPLQANNRFFTNLAYETPERESSGGKWKFDFTYNWLGEQRLPNTASNPSAYRLPDYADSYSLLNAQVTKVFSKRFEIYAGAENITNYKQKNPIIGSDDPFGSYFDSTIIYAPIFGSNFYTGLRFKLN